MNYDLKARLWQRDSTQEWVLELSGTINDTTFVTRHAEPLTTTPEDAVGLPSLYAAIAALEAGRSSGDPWPTIRARLELAIEHGDAHGWYTARNELLGVIGSDYAAAPQQPTGRSGEANGNSEGAVGCLTISRFRGCDSMVNHDFDYFGDLPDGSYSLYRTPPASIPVSEVQALVDELRAEIKPYRNFPTPTDKVRKQCADRLEKLIPRSHE